MDRIEAAIAEVEAAAQPQADAPKPEATEAPATEVKEAEVTETVDNKPKDEPWPKKAVNTVARLKSDKYKLRMEKEQMAARYEKEIAELRAKAPKEKDFENKTYEELLDAKVDHRAKISATEAALESAKKESAEIGRDYSQERNEILRESATAGREAFPDFQKTMDEYAARIDNLPAELHPVVLETDNSPQALYSIIKDGLFDEFASLPPSKRLKCSQDMRIKRGHWQINPRKHPTPPNPCLPQKERHRGVNRSTACLMRS